MNPPQTADAPPERLRLDRMATPIGEALLVVDEQDRLRAFDWSDHEDRMQRLLHRHYGARPLDHGRAPASVRTAIRNYFDGDLHALRVIAWRTAGTEFQRQVWAGLCDIAPGDTLSYGSLAVRLRRASAVRAVGLANGANPVGLVVPCHRVIGADGSLTGYGGGLSRKRWLLRHEGAIPDGGQLFD